MNRLWLILSSACSFFVLCVNVSAQQPVLVPESTPTPPPTTSVQIVNATSVPSISLEVNGRLDYPDFPQGEFTSDAPTEGLTYRYKATNKTDGVTVSLSPVVLKNQENQTVLFIGDFKETEEGKMPLSDSAILDERQSDLLKPNLLLRVYSHQEALSKKPIRVRVINGMPGKTLRLRSPRQMELLPGDEKELEGEPLVQMYVFQAGNGNEIPVLMRQDSNPKNANIVFYLKNNEPAFMRFFESTGRPPVE